MKKAKILILAGALSMGVVVLVAAILRKSPVPKVMRPEEAQQRVQQLERKITVPIDEATREKIDTLSNDLVQEHSFAEIDGEKRSLSTIAGWELRRMGEAAIPQLINAAANHQDPVVRQYAVGIIHLICQDKNADLIEYLPVFVRSTYDKDPSVRLAAISQISQIARRFYRHKRQKEVEQVMPYLVQALSDEDYVVQVIAGETLFRIGRRDLVPQELITKERWE